MHLKERAVLEIRKGINAMFLKKTVLKQKL
jgi:hypothetical protein